MDKRRVVDWKRMGRGRRVEGREEEGVEKVKGKEEKGKGGKIKLKKGK